MDPETTRHQIKLLETRIAIACAGNSTYTEDECRALCQAKLALVEAYAIQVEAAAREPGCGCGE